MRFFSKICSDNFINNNILTKIEFESSNIPFLRILQ